ncbi:MAG: helix-turn-helix domain-containing protein [Polyangiaceae bacterium]
MKRKAPATKRRAAPVKREDRAERRREEILAVAERIFAEKGYHATGIADIAAVLGLGHGTFYRYFKNKHDIALAVFDRLLGRIGEIALTEDPESARSIEDYRAQTQRLLTRWLALVEEHPHLVRFLHEQTVVIDLDRLGKLIEAYVEFTARFLENGKARRFLRADLDVRATAEMLVALILDGTRRALEDPDVKATRRRVDAGIALMFDGIRR